VNNTNQKEGSMKRTFLRLANVATVALVAAWPALAQTPPPPSTGPGSAPSQRMEQSPGGANRASSQKLAPGGSAVIPNRDSTQILARELIGNSVVTQDGVEVGKVEDLILDGQGRVNGIVISTGGFLGLGGKSVGVSSDAVDMRSGKERDMVFVKLSSAEVKSAPPLRKPPPEQRVKQEERREERPRTR
jgi:sporulation protein YlmC with PRC-barrel domain